MAERETVKTAFLVPVFPSVKLTSATDRAGSAGGFVEPSQVITTLEGLSVIVPPAPTKPNWTLAPTEMLEL